MNRFITGGFTVDCPERDPRKLPGAYGYNAAGTITNPLLRMNLGLGGAVDLDLPPTTANQVAASQVKAPSDMIAIGDILSRSETGR